MFSIQEDDEVELEAEAVSPPLEKKGTAKPSSSSTTTTTTRMKHQGGFSLDSSLVQESIAEESEGEVQEEKKKPLKDKAKASSIIISSSIESGDASKTSVKEETAPKPNESQGGGGGGAAAYSTAAAGEAESPFAEDGNGENGEKRMYKRRERSIALPNIMESQTRSAKSLWTKGKVKVSAIRGFAKSDTSKETSKESGGGGEPATSSSTSEKPPKEKKEKKKKSKRKSMKKDERRRDSRGGGGGDSEPSSLDQGLDVVPTKLAKKRQSVVVAPDSGTRRTSVLGMGMEGGAQESSGRRHSTIMAPGPGGGRRESTLGLGGRRESMMGRRESMMGRRESMMGGRRVSMMGRRESSMMLPGGRRESTLFRRESTYHRQSVFGVTDDDYSDPTSRMNKRQSSVFLQSEFEEEMRRREREAKTHQSVKDIATMSEEEKKKYEKQKAERLAKRDDVLSHNDRVRRIIAKWKMREVQSMFLSWKRYTKKKAKAREAEAAIAPFLEVLAKESWERDEKDVDLLYSFVKKIKFFQELEENMSRDLCKMFKLEEYDEDEIVVRQGDEGDSFYIILYGSVSIWLEPKEDSAAEGSGEEQSEVSGERSASEVGSESESSSGSYSSSEYSSSSEESSSSSEDEEDQSEVEEEKEKEEEKEEEEEEEVEATTAEAEGADTEEGGEEGEQKKEEGEEGEGEGEEEGEEGGRILLCTRGPGDSFGELSLLKNQPRAATVQTDEPTFFVVIDKPNYDRTIKTRHQRKILDKVDFLCKLPVFHKCNISELAEFVCYLSEVEHPRNKIILGQGDDASNVHFVVRGTVQIIKSVPMKSKDSDQKFGHALLGVYGPGTFFGHNAILTKSDQPYSVVTVVETTTYVLSLHDFFLRLNSMTLQIIKDSLHDNLSDEQTQTCIKQHMTSNQCRKSLIDATLPPKPPKANSHNSVFRNYDVVRKKNAELNAKFQRNVSNGKKSTIRQKKIEDLLGDDEESEKLEDMTVKYGLAAAIDALKDKTHDLAKFIQARTNIHQAQPKVNKEVPKSPRKVTDLRIEELIHHNETFMEFTSDCALLVGKVIAEDENALIPHDLMDRVFKECEKISMNYHLVFLRWSSNSFRLVSEPIHTSQEQLRSVEMLIKIANAALQINQCIEKYNDENYDQQEMLYENASGIAYGTAFLRKNSKTKEICDVEGQVYDIAAELCLESTEFGGVRCNEDICEQLNLTHSLIISGSQYVLDGRLEQTVEQYTSVLQDITQQDATMDESDEHQLMQTKTSYDIRTLEKPKYKSRKYSNSNFLTSKGKYKQKKSSLALLSKAINHSYDKQHKHIFNKSINDISGKQFKLPHIVQAKVR